MPNAKRKQKLTKAIVAALKAEAKEYSVWDTLVEGFHVRIFPSGSKKLYVFYRSKRGQSRRRPLGAFPLLQIDEARDQARKFVVAAKAGTDLYAERDALRQIPTLAMYWNLHWSDHVSVKKARRSAESDETLWRRHLNPTFGGKFVDQIDVSDVRRWHSRLASLPGAANRALALLSRLMTLSVEAGYRPSNPCKGVERYSETPRDPSLTSQELSRLWVEVESEEMHGDKGAARMVKLIMLTGALRGEVLNAKWSEFDLLSDMPIWKVPTEHIKGGKRRKIVITRNLSRGVCEMLMLWRTEISNPEAHLFPSRIGELHARLDINKPWQRIREAAGRVDLRLHDLRHVFATLAIGEGHTLEEIGETLGHRSAMTTRRYAHIVARQKNQVANSVSDRVFDIVPKPDVRPDTKSG